MASILLLRVVYHKKNINLCAGTIVVSIEEYDLTTKNSSSNHIAFMVPDGKVVRIRDVSLSEIMIDRDNVESNPSRNVPDSTRELRIWRDGTKVWSKNGQYHRDAQPGQSPGPAIEYADGTKEWYKNGQLHRDAQPGQSPGPSIERLDGTKWWYKEGLLHRDDGPVFEYLSGMKDKK